MLNRLALNRQSSLVLLLFLLLVVATLLWGQTASEARAYDLNDQGSRGLLLLRRWLQEMGYQVTTTGSTSFNVPAERGLLFIYPGQEPFTEAEATALAEWVEAGGSLAIIGAGDVELTRAFAYEWAAPGVAAMSFSARQVQPLLPQAPTAFTGPGSLSLPQVDETGHAVPVLVTGAGQPVVWVQQRGAGMLWLLPLRYAFTNSDLMQSDQPHLLLALLRTLADGGTVTFDTYHLYGPNPLADGRILSLRDWLYGTFSGWATLFLLLLCGAYLLLQGRRLGPPLVVVTQGRRREAAEFVVAMADLQRRARVRDSIARHHRHRLLLALGRPQRIPADLGNEAFIDHLRRADASLNKQRTEEISTVLHALSRMPNEEELVTLVAKIDTLIARKEVP